MQDLRCSSIRAMAVALLAALALLGAGCSSEDDPAAGDATSTTAAESGALWSGPMPNTGAMTPEDAKVIDDAASVALSETPGVGPGLWLGVWDAEKGMHLSAQGDAVLDGAAAGTDQIGRIGSVTKTFTAAAVLQQVSQGWASLDDTIEDQLPDLAKKYPDVASITIEQLLAMNSGIPDYANSTWFLQMVVDDPTKVWSAGEIIDMVLDRGDLADPGTAGYSTTNFLILGQMLEGLVEGNESISTILTDLAENEGLTRTALPEPSDASLPDPYSNGYVSELGSADLATLDVTVPPGTDVTDWSPSWGGAGGAMYANIEDLGTWAATGLGTDLLSKKLGDQRIDDTTDVPDVGEYGLGLQVFGNGWIGHTGQIIGWEAFVAYNTDTGDTFVAIVNETSSLVAAYEVAGSVFPELAQALL